MLLTITHEQINRFRNSTNFEQTQMLESIGYENSSYDLRVLGIRY